MNTFGVSRSPIKAANVVRKDDACLPLVIRCLNFKWHHGKIPLGPFGQWRIMPEN
jgi:hypothetical protein